MEILLSRTSKSMKTVWTLGTTLFFCLATKNIKKWRVVRRLLALSHELASVARGFSVNKEIFTDNMVAQCIITDYLVMAGDAGNVPRTKALLCSAFNARTAYKQPEEKRQMDKNRNQCL